MKQRIVGTYPMGNQMVQLVLQEGQDGAFYVTPGDIQYPRIKVGADLPSWNKVASVLLHEALELQMTLSGCRFEPAPDFARDHSSYLFAMNHQQFSDVTARVAILVAACLPDLASAWNKWNPTR